MKIQEAVRDSVSFTVNFFKKNIDYDMESCGFYNLTGNGAMFCIHFMKRRFVFFITLIAGMMSCSVDTVPDLPTLQSYLLDSRNGLMHMCEEDGYTLRVIHKPTDQMAYEDLGDNEADTMQLRALRAKYERFYYFVLSLSSDGKEALHDKRLSYEHYSALVQTLSFDMGHFVKLVTPTDTVEVFDFALNRTYGYSRSTDVLLAFPKDRTAGAAWVKLCVDEFGLGFGQRQFQFRREDFNDIPKIEP